MSKNIILRSLTATIFGGALFLSGCVAREAAEIEKAFLQERFSGSYEVGVSQTTRGISLDGYAASESDRERMIAIASEIAGSREIIADISIQPPQRIVEKVAPVPPTDEEIRVSVSKIIQSVKNNPESEVNIRGFEVRAGDVTLHGEAVSFREVDSLLARIATIHGVRDLHSDITVNGKAYMEKWGQYQKKNG